MNFYVALGVLAHQAAVLIKCDITGPNLRLEFEKYYNVLHLVVYVGTLISPLSGARRQKYHSSTKSAEGEG